MDGLILFDDGERLGPLCDLRASFELRTGALTTSERLVEQIGTHAAALIAPPGMTQLLAARHGLPVNRLPDGASFMLINGRLTRLTFELPARMNTLVTDRDDIVLAARVDRRTAEAFLAEGAAALDELESAIVEDAPLIRRPWEILTYADMNLEHDLTTLAKRLRRLDGEPSPRVTVVGGNPVLIGRNTTVHPHVVFDTSAGPVCIDDGAEIRSMSVLVGPGYIGPGSAIANHAHIRGHTIIGPQCKVGGEVNHSVFQGYANKAHSGYLGNSYLGEWVNFGADTVTSNLKNTYGPVRMQIDPAPGSQALDTGLTHLGSIIGDHVKTAIGTRLLTGSCIHTGAMLATAKFPPKCVQRFAFITDDGEENYQLDKFCEVAQTVMSRRNVKFTEAMRGRIMQLHDEK
ncbi:MAG: hypothetical protein GC162_11995 [Planctomycetes bacterium]|nr:hypothetical protein [Planctomycetota bacterium]